MLHCIHSFRLVPGKRVVCQGIWHDREVIAKLYFESRSARRNWKKEVEGLEAFHKRGIRAPRILHTGTAERGTIFVVLMQPVSAARSLEEVWKSCLDETDKVAFLIDVVAILAQHHNAGLVQHDLHLKNFLSSDGKIYTLDGGNVRIQNQPLRMRRSIANLGLLFAQLYPENDHLIRPVFSSYMERRGWQASSSAEALVRSSAIFFRRKHIKKYLKKVFRQCTEFVCEQNSRSYRVYRRTLACPELNRIIDSPDASLSFPNTKILKKGEIFHRMAYFGRITQTGRKAIQYQGNMACTKDICAQESRCYFLGRCPYLEITRNYDCTTNSDNRGAFWFASSACLVHH